MASDDITFDVPAVEVTDEDEKAVDILIAQQSSQLLADALKRMDGLIGDYRPPSELVDVSMVNDPVVMTIVDYCNQLSELMMSWDEQKQEGVKGHPKDCVQIGVRETIVKWLSSKQAGSPQQMQQLQQDKSELLKQVVSLQQQLDAVNMDREKLSNKVADLERRAIEREQQIRTLSEEVRVTKTTLQTKEVEIRHLHNEIQAGYKKNSYPSEAQKVKKVSTHLPPTGDKPMSRKGSIRRTLAKKFGKKKTKSATLEEMQDTSPVKPVNPRAAKFYSMNCEGVSEWFSSIGMDMYSDLAEQNLLSGEVLAGMVSRQGNAELVRVGIVSTLHCKKLRLAVEDALSETPCRVSTLDHNWVGEWLCDIGLPQYQRTFMDARFDGRMLNVITVDDLLLLDVTTPFHVASIKRALQALRMCGYDGNYLKDSCLQKTHGSQKLLHWSVNDVVQWVRGIELDDYIGGFSNTGIHGAIMLLDVQFTSDSLARVLGIDSSKSLIRTHLSRKFMELIGPVTAQKKVDAMQSKTFLPLDPTEQPKGPMRSRSRSMGSRRARQQSVPELLLCPFEEFPESLYSTKSLLSPTSSVSSGASPIIK